MKFASLKSESRDGTLVLVSRDLERMLEVPDCADHLQALLDDWQALSPGLEPVYADLNAGRIRGRPMDTAVLAAPLPRAYQWLDGSAYLSHVERVRRARGARMPPNLLRDPLMYQGGSDGFLGPRDPICLPDESWGADFEAEVAVVTDDVPLGTTAAEAGNHIRLLMLVNDLSLRNLIPEELAKGFGFLQGKPASSFSPVAVTADELGTSWDGGKVNLPLLTSLNGRSFGHPNAAEDLQFDFRSLISHAARTRALAAGTIIGSGTVSNGDLASGCSCILERRMLEILETGRAETPFLRFGDRVRIEMRDREGGPLFGAIEQEVQPCPA
ncbi:MAG: fumarylacetoacetate hydrolase family protein [Pseudomonadota bacterium]|nr:fumarylacetoacetate hydrolase family protein [Pseudomonadota bacterium]